ncbi:poly(glycerol-phosphate) alpha-glucosyltransferase [Staphylococcus sp. SQ8-PEA]|uniref:Poly(Glycerol-phosphate) alpha-glucosyltransferase n=1 Tax=Staphylococcus marylandisciuri TaxID=2981529 RepID=A0ABT2QSN2_9STAP|nr:poly(glycerol-phosphate) alpha-glucosyltransferase [Staphylococcus marylandisciuri]MCU5747000.1 poly(glycerol-phosphate) alpha-glucosyltransferase [Staphylococcus marylandisciuri]
MNILESKINELLSYIENDSNLTDRVFISMGSSHTKAKVLLIKKSKSLLKNILKNCQNFKRKHLSYPTWIKIDIVTDETVLPFTDIKHKLLNTRRNYVDFGISFDKYWYLSFLPEEINSNAFIRPSKDKKRFILSENNINNYLRKYTSYKKKFRAKDFDKRDVIQFHTESYILDDSNIIKLEKNGSHKQPLRKIEDLHAEIDSMIDKGVHFLKDMLEDSGKYIYGYFPHFDKKINFYNILRHSSSSYALIEGLTYIDEDISFMKKAIDYVIDNHIISTDDVSYVFDNTNNINEIKLGQNASFIFMVCEYLKAYPDDINYLKIAQNVARGILSMIDIETGNTTHVLNYPSLTVKESFRIVYYDGEAALALLRLYKIDNNENWLNTVQKLFEHFINEKYWRYHDHWLAYCTNELSQIIPSERYYKFGILNASTHLKYIKDRETTYPTFLEMLVATYRLIQNAKENGYHDLVSSLIDEDELVDTIHNRADYQRTGHFYPEYAMYFKLPHRILGSFFIKHHGYRVRIDDIEHYISGYIQYQKEFKNKSS